MANAKYNRHSPPILRSSSISILLSEIASVLCILFGLMQPIKSAELLVPPESAYILKTGRIALVNPVEKTLQTPAMQLIIRQEKARLDSTFRSRKKKSRSRSPIISPVAPVKTRGSSEEQSNIQKPMASEDDIPPSQWRTVASALLRDILSRRLQDRTGVVLTDESVVRSALAASGTNESDESSVSGLTALNTTLKIDAILTPEITRVDFREAGERSVLIWGKMKIVGIVGALSRLQLNSSSSVLPAAESAAWMFPISGVATNETAAFRPAAPVSRLGLVRRAVNSAALAIMHTLYSGEMDPFATLGTRLALLPLVSPIMADKLIFKDSGRETQIVSLGSLPADLSVWFRPNLLPITTRYIVDTSTTGSHLSSRALSSAHLWTSEYEPSSIFFQELGRRLKTDYILAARINYIELEQGQKENSLGISVSSNSRKVSDPVVHAARAEAAGTLIRVADGAILWKEFASASMTTQDNPAIKKNSNDIDRTTARDAVKFALIELQRKFRKYRSKFQQPVQE